MSGEKWVGSSASYVQPRGPGQPDAWTEELRAKARSGSQRIAYAGEAAAPREVAERFDIAVGAPVVARQRVMYVADSAVELTDTYYPLTVGRGTRLAGPSKIPGGAITLLAELGYTSRHVHEEVHARMPNDSERRTLDLADEEPVLCLTRVTDAGDRPFQVDISVFPATAQRLHYELRTG